MKKLLKFSAISLVASAFLIGCGSSGGSDDDSQKQTSISGKAVDGYLKSATVVLDLDGNGFLSAGEPVTATDENGGFTLTVTDEQRAYTDDKNNTFDTAMLLVYDGIDNDTGKRYTGKLKAPNDGKAKINVTPMTTQVAAVVQKSLKSGGVLTKDEILKKIKDSKLKVKKALNIPDNIDIGADPVALAKDESGVDTKAFLGANIALQKAIDTMVNAAKKESKNSSTDEQNIADQMFEALAIGFDKFDLNSTNDSDFGISKLIEHAATDDEAKVLMGENAAGSYRAAMQVADQTQDIFENDEIDFSDFEKFHEELMQATIIAEQLRDQYLQKFEEANFDFAISDDDMQNDLAFDVNMSMDFQTARLKNYFGDQNLSDDVIAKMKDQNLSALSLSDIEERLKKDDEFKSISKKLEEDRKKQEAEQKAKENASKMDKIAFASDEVIYDMYDDYDDNKKYYKYTEVTLGDLKINFKDYKFKNNKWQEAKDDENSEDKDLTFIDGQWKIDDGSYTRSSDNTELIFNDGGVLTKNFKNNLDGVSYIPAIGLDVYMPKGAIEYGLKIENKKEVYELYEKARDYTQNGENYLSSFEELIQSQCGNRWFTGNHNGGYAFAGVENENGNYTCDTTATSGKLSEVSNNNNQGSEVTSNDAGTWEIKTLANNNKVLIAKPYNNKSYSDGDDWDEYTIFAPIVQDGESTLYRGDMRESGTVNTFSTYNNIAIAAMKKAVENKLLGTDIGAKVYKQDWKIVTKDDRYSNFDILPNIASYTVGFTVYKRYGEDSRAEVKSKLSEETQNVQVGVKYEQGGYHGSFNLKAIAFNTSTNSILSGLSSQENLNIFAAISVFPWGIAPYLSIEDNQGNEHSYDVGNILDFDSSNENKIIDQKLILSISKNANTISFKVFKEDGQTQLGQTVTKELEDITSSNNFEMAKVGTRIKDYNNKKNTPSKVKASVYGFSINGDTPTNDNISSDNNDNNSSEEFTSPGAGHKEAVTKTIEAQKAIFEGNIFYSTYIEDDIKVIDKVTFIDNNKITWENVQRSDNSNLEHGVDSYTINDMGVHIKSISDNDEPNDDDEFNIKTIYTYDNGIDVLFYDEEDGDFGFLFTNQTDAITYYNNL